MENEKWIPTSKKLPKENETIENVWKYYLVQNEYGDIFVARLSNIGWIPWDWDESLKPTEWNVVAWMPLPQPYK